MNRNPHPWGRSLRSEMWWILDNVLQAHERMDVGRNFGQVKQQVIDYRHARGVPPGKLQTRPLPNGRARVWKFAAGYEKPDP